MRTRRPGPRPGIIAASCTALLLSIAVSAHAFTVHGTIENGTTGKTVESAKVSVVSPSAGMMEESQVEAVDGHFEVPNLEASAPIYLLRVEFDGIEYNTPVTVNGQDQTVKITVYDATTSWKGIHVAMPHLAAVRDGDHLTIEELFQITNETDPPRTANGDEGFFHLFLPAAMESLTSCFVTSLGVPVDRTPTPTSRAGIYTIDYPIRPGETRIGVSYVVPYKSDEFSLTQKVLYNIDNLTVFAVDPSMKISSTSHKLEAQEGVHGMTAYAVPGLTRGETLALKFSGGEPHPAGVDASDTGGGGGGSGGGTQNISVVPVDTSQLSVFLMMAMLLVLFGLGIVALRETRDPLSDSKILRRHYDALVLRLARLDDLRAADTIPAEAYRATREDIVNRLSALALRMRAQKGGGKSRGRSGASNPSHTPRAAKSTPTS